MSLDLILFILVFALLVIILYNSIRFKRIKEAFLEEIDEYEEKIIDQKSKIRNAETKLESYIHLKEDLHVEDIEKEKVNIKNSNDLYNNIIKYLHKQNKSLINKINKNIIFITKGDNLFEKEVNNESEILLALSSLNLNYQNFYLGKSNPKLIDLATLALHYKENYFIINNNLEKAIKENDEKEIKKLLSLWSNKKYTQSVVNILAKKNFMKRADMPKIIAIMSDTAIEKLNKINPKIIEAFNKKDIYIKNIHNIADFIEKAH